MLNKMFSKILATTLIVGLLGLMLASCLHSNDDNSSSSPTVSIGFGNAVNNRTGGGSSDGGNNSSNRGAIENPIETPLRIGLLSPRTGALRDYDLGPVRAAELAVNDIKAAGKNIELISNDTGTDPSIADNSLELLLNDEVHGIVGAYSSLVSTSIVDKVIEENLVMISPASSTQTFTNYPDRGLLFRTVSSNQLWAEVIANEIANDSSARRIAIIFRNDRFGSELAQGVKDRLEATGNTTIAQFTGYEFNRPDSINIASQARAKRIDSVLLISFAEGVDILYALIQHGVGPSNIRMYSTVEDFGSKVAKNKIEKDRPALSAEHIIDINPTPHPEGDPLFNASLREFAPDANDVVYNASTYDAVVVLALASVVANSVDPLEFAKEINGVTKGGRKCRSFADCANLALEGIDIDYDGASGPLEFNDAGEPSTNSYAIFTYGSRGEQGPAKVVIAPLKDSE